MSFRTKIFLLVASLLLAVSIVTAAVLAVTESARVRKTIEADFERAPDILREHFKRTVRGFDDDARAWAENRQFAAWLGRASAADVFGEVAAKDLKAAHDGLGALMLPRFQVANDAGMLLFDPNHQDAFGEVLSGDPAVRRALDGFSALRIRGDYLTIASPVLVEGNVRGVLIARIPAEAERFTAASILHGEVSFPDQPPSEDRVRTEVRGGETWMTATVTIPGTNDGDVVGWATLSRSLTAEIALQERGLLATIALTTVIGLAIALIASLLLARSLAAPVARLTAATKEIARGNYDHRVDQTSNDELGDLAGAFNVMAAGLKARVFFESALRRYLAAPVVEQLIDDPSRLRLGGERREVTVLFFDVAGFTSLAETLPAEDLVTLVNAYLDTLVEAIFRHQGTFDKFIGDAVMAFWGAPIAAPDHARLACLAAIDMQRAFRDFTKGHASPYVRSLDARIGINSGVAALGNLGSSQVMSYTAMGDAVNVASRLEGLNKAFGTTLLVSETTVAGAAWERAREVDMVRVVGRGTPLRVFELFSAEDAPPPEALIAYAVGLGHYRAARFREAEKAFRDAQAAGDGRCAEVMAERSAQLGAHVPSEWDGVYQSKAK